MLGHFEQPGSALEGFEIRLQIGDSYTSRTTSYTVLRDVKSPRVTAVNNLLQAVRQS